MPLKQQRLTINIDHVATIRQARRGDEPNPVDAVPICEGAGANGITAHLREDRRHVQDADIRQLKERITTYFNFELACTDEIVAFACEMKPEQATLVPERREEITTEGGLDVFSDPARISESVARLQGAGIRVSLFIDPDLRAVEQSKELGATAVELHTGTYALHPADPSNITALRSAALRGAEMGMKVHVGHGLNVRNVGLVAAIPQVEELNIGHSVISRAVFVGLDQAVREIRAAIDAAGSKRE
ncbi:MAG: pyridoxine 5'-phosphate synthase [Gemmatimonadaceae bacterium]|nr:pyridoxine 5'-phosphate synthase [Gemmatimonadaceae bacterium]